VNPLFARLDIPSDTDTLDGIKRLVSERASETRHLDFKQQVHNPDDLADDLCALANSGGGVIIIGVGTDKMDCATSLHEHPLHVVEQQAVQAARDGIDEPLRIEPLTVPGDTDPGQGYLVVAIPPSDRTPHITVKRGRVLHRVGTHNKPMTRREIGAAFASAGEMFTIEFGLTRGSGGTSLICELIESHAGVYNKIRVMNTGTLAASEISIDSTTGVLLWEKDEERSPDEPPRELLDRFSKENFILDPPYLPIKILPSGTDVILSCYREYGTSKQDVLRVTWRTPDGQVHLNEQSWSWTPRGR
jgi:Putative DNA-binding domain